MPCRIMATPIKISMCLVCFFSFGEETDKLFKMDMEEQRTKKSHELLKNNKVKGLAILYIKTF